MNAALIHDQYAMKKFWEQKIAKQRRIAEDELSRMKTSALSKVRAEWIKRLDIRTKHLKKAEEDNLKKPQLQTEDQA